MLSVSSVSLSCEFSKLKMVWGTSKFEIGIRSEGSVEACSLATFTEKAFPEASTLVPVLFNTGTRKKHAWSSYWVGPRRLHGCWGVGVRRFRRAAVLFFH